MTHLNFDYDQQSDVLYATFGPPVPAIGDDLEGNDSVVLRYDQRSGKMVGFTLIQIGRERGGLDVPLIAGDVRGEHQGIRQDTPWLKVKMLPDAILEIGMRGSRHKMRFPVSTLGGGVATDVNLEQLLETAHR